MPDGMDRDETTQRLMHLGLTTHAAREAEKLSADGVPMYVGHGYSLWYDPFDNDWHVDTRANTPDPPVPVDHHTYPVPLRGHVPVTAVPDAGEKVFYQERDIIPPEDIHPHPQPLPPWA